MTESPGVPEAPPCFPGSPTPSGPWCTDGVFRIGALSESPSAGPSVQAVITAEGLRLVLGDLLRDTEEAYCDWLAVREGAHSDSPQTFNYGLWYSLRLYRGAQDVAVVIAQCLNPEHPTGSYRVAKGGFEQVAVRTARLVLDGNGLRERDDSPPRKLPDGGTEFDDFGCTEVDRPAVAKLLRRLRLKDEHNDPSATFTLDDLSRLLQLTPERLREIMNGRIWQDSFGLDSDLPPTPEETG
ncbi:hypothetical protein [Streptomyces fractus]|uniref:hypothetical protein n=1 Tax=Streptomyces fractus TaxID=641806 RepID=UPI003CF013BC